MDAERKSLIKELKSKKLEYESFINRRENSSFKSAELSLKARKEGNNLYLKKNHDSLIHKEILQLYCKSVALAPSGSDEIALAFGNRSAFLFHIKKYKESIKDIDRALSITNSKILKVKLSCRKIECLLALGSVELTDLKNLLEKAKFFANKISEDDKNKVQLLESINKIEVALNTKMQHAIQESEEKIKVLENLVKKDDANIFNFVDIRFSEKYGRYLEASCDFEPGEIIFVEKCYATCLTPKTMYTHCNNCLLICWSGIPCENCSGAMFCSDECKKEALEKYHDIECSVVSYLRNDVDKVVDSFHLSIRTLIMGFKEAGSLAKLKDDLKLVDQSKDNFLEVFKNSKKPGSKKFISLYCLRNGERPSKVINLYLMSTSLTLIYFTKHTSIFGNTFKPKNINDLIANEDAIFVGSLLVKLCNIKDTNSHSFSEMLGKQCVYSKDKETCKNDLCCLRGTSISPVASLVNHSCFPNARRCFTDDGKIILYAIQPIKKYSQIFDTYSSNFYTESKSKRQKYLDSHNFICDCPACKNNWPELLILPVPEQEILDARPKSQLEIELFIENGEIFRSIDNGNSKFDEKILETLSTSTSKAIKGLKQPSPITCILLRALQYVFATIYGFKQESFGQCT